MVLTDYDEFGLTEGDAVHLANIFWLALMMVFGFEVGFMMVLRLALMMVLRLALMMVLQWL